VAPGEWPLLSGPWRVALAQRPLQEFAPATSVPTGPVSNVPAFQLLEQTPTMALPSCYNRINLPVCDWPVALVIEK